MAGPRRGSSPPPAPPSPAAVLLRRSPPPFQLLPSRSHASPAPPAPTAPVDLQFIQKFWAPLAAYVKAHEHGTLAYEIAIADTDPLKIQVFERWVGACSNE